MKSQRVAAADPLQWRRAVGERRLLVTCGNGGTRLDLRFVAPINRGYTHLLFIDSLIQVGNTSRGAGEQHPDGTGERRHAMAGGEQRDCGGEGASGSTRRPAGSGAATTAGERRHVTAGSRRWSGLFFYFFSFFFLVNSNTAGGASGCNEHLFTAM